MQTAPVAWGDTGLRPAVSVSTQSAPEGIRTPNLLIRSQMLYPLSYGCVVPSRGGTKSYLSASGRHRRNRPPQRHDGPSTRGPDGVCRPVAHPTRRTFVALPAGSENPARNRQLVVAFLAARPRCEPSHRIPHGLR